MFGFWRRSAAVVVPAVAMIFFAAPVAFAGEMDGAIRTATAASLPGNANDQATADVDPGSAVEDAGKLWLADYHPETDRWTERNNRIKISLLQTAMFFSAEQRIKHEYAPGLRVAWEVPGFISIRLDAIGAPWSRLATRSVNNTGAGNASSERYVQGFFVCNTLDVGIFNPELSFAPNLAMWAGFGVDLWNYHYASRIGGFSYHFVDWNVGGNFFFDLQYKITDIFHVGFGFREHILYTPQTERGNFVRIESNPRTVQPGAALGQPPFGAPHSRRDGLPVPISIVSEFNLSISILF